MRGDDTPGERFIRALEAHGEDPRVVEAMAAVPREAFVPAALRDRAWEDGPLPIGESQTISQPSLVARMCALLRLEGHERVLDVGTGSGYQAAVLSRLCTEVISIERHPSLARTARESLDRAGVDGVTIHVGDGSRGWPEGAPYGAIIVAAASAERVPPGLERQLAPGGRLIVPVGTEDQRLTLVERGDRGTTQRDVGGVRFVPLVRDAS